MEGTTARVPPCGLQDVLNRLAVVALANKPVCFYECFAEALERDVIRRTLLEVQAEQYKPGLTLDAVAAQLASPHNCVRCGLAMTDSAPGADSTDPSASDIDYDRVDGPAAGRPPHVGVSEPSLVSSRSSTPPAPLRGSVSQTDDDECASLLSSEDVAGYPSSSDDVDSEYVSAMEVAPAAAGRHSSDTFNDVDDANMSAKALDETMMPGDVLHESSNSASTLLDDDGQQRPGLGSDVWVPARTGVDSSSQEDSELDDDDDDVFGDELSAAAALLADLSDDAEADVVDCSSPIVPLLSPLGDSDTSDA